LSASAGRTHQSPTSKKRDKAASLIVDAYAGKAAVKKAKKTFEIAGREAKVWMPYRGLA
jgi:hypothetical protein